MKFDMSRLEEIGNIIEQEVDRLLDGSCNSFEKLEIETLIKLSFHSMQYGIIIEAIYTNKYFKVYETIYEQLKNECERIGKDRFSSKFRQKVFNISDSEISEMIENSIDEFKNLRYKTLPALTNKQIIDAAYDIAECLIEFDEVNYYADYLREKLDPNTGLVSEFSKALQCANLTVKRNRYYSKIPIIDAMLNVNKPRNGFGVPDGFCDDKVLANLLLKGHMILADVHPKTRNLLCYE